MAVFLFLNINKNLVLHQIQWKGEHESRKNIFGLYLHFFSGVAGFNVWKGEVVKKRDWQEFTLISEIMQIMTKALYKVPAGYDLN